jgi:hypothetical protein
MGIQHNFLFVKNRFSFLSISLFIEISCFQPGDSGRYTITANNGVGRPATHKFDIEVELPESRPKFQQPPRDVTMVAGDDHVIVAVITGVPKPEVTVTDKNGNVVPGEGQIEEIDDETIRFSLDLPDIQVIIMT